MNLMKATKFREEYFSLDSRPDIKTVKKWIDENEIPGRKLGTTYYVDIDKLERSNNPLVNKVLAA